MKRILTSTIALLILVFCGGQVHAQDEIIVVEVDESAFNWGNDLIYLRPSFSWAEDGIDTLTRNLNGNGFTIGIEHFMRDRWSIGMEVGFTTLIPTNEVQLEIDHFVIPAYITGGYHFGGERLKGNIGIGLGSQIDRRVAEDFSQSKVRSSVAIQAKAGFTWFFADRAGLSANYAFHYLEHSFVEDGIMQQVSIGISFHPEF
ncbi:outer membrane beta-barrel protein [Pontibacter sp. G13]|uniref:outer membrane beta-barrel protein n=1 Tax=Pontibacter sp. G13 TaxID=3074898 RepID=UPI00288C631B|nr:outer membrane beta-barrel protein [Pontibacter sp. G13]WNJ19528.1 outer membrane beta-barrel protein [Pontibacter sp. G13]